MPRESNAISPFGVPLRQGRRGWAGADSLSSGLCQLCQPPAAATAARLLPGLESKWGPALLPAPTVAAAGTLAFQRLSSPRPSAVPCPSEPPPCGKGSSGLPFVSRPSRWAGVPFLSGRLVLRRPQFLTAWAWQSLVPLPPLPRRRVRRCCWRVASLGPSGTAPSGSALARLAFRRIPQGEKGPFRASRRAAPRVRLCRLRPRSCDHRPCRISLASGRRSGIRNRCFRLAFPRFQSAPQHAGNGFIANFPFRSDREIFAFQSVPCGASFRLRFPLDKTDAAPER